MCRCCRPRPGFFSAAIASRLGTTWHRYRAPMAWTGAGRASNIITSDRFLIFAKYKDTFMTSNACDIQIPATEIQVAEAIRFSDPDTADTIRRMAFELDVLRA